LSPGESAPIAVIRSCRSGLAAPATKSPLQSTWENMKHAYALLLAGLLVAPAHNLALAGEASSQVVATSSPETESNPQCDAHFCIEDQAIEAARAYLVETARPGGTMTRQGPEIAIERLHPDFAKRLAGAIREARAAGLSDAGIFSAYRPPVFGVGGFADKFYSLHAYGLAVDMHGIGRSGSEEAQRWHEIAARHGIVCPYGYRNRAEWNHCQPTHLVAVKAENPLRDTIVPSGPIDLRRMFEAGTRFIADAGSVLTSVVADRSTAVVRAVKSRLNSEGRQQARSEQRNVRSARHVKKARASRLARKAPSPSRFKVAHARKTTKVSREGG
jgi:hypothetical protein